MAKLSEKQKTTIRAKFKTGEFSKRELARKYKVAETSVRRIIGDAQPVHQETIKKGVEVEMEKRRMPGAETDAVIQAIKKRTQRIEMADTIIDVGMKSTLKAAAKVNKDLDRIAISAKELNTHQRTIKMATETARLAVSEETPQVIINNTNQQHQEQEQEQTQEQEQEQEQISTQKTMALMGLL